MSRINKPNASIASYTDTNATVRGDFFKGKAQLLHEILSNPGVFGGWGRSDAVRVPMGTGTLSVLGSGGGLSTVVHGRTTAPTGALPPAIDRRDNAQDQGIVQMNKPGNYGSTWFGRMGMKWSDLTEDAKRQAIAEAAQVVRVTPPITTLPTSTGSTGSMDLGTLIGDLGTAYINARYSGPAQQTMTNAPVNTTPAFSGNVLDFLTDPVDSTVDAMFTKKKKCRRRRRRLATLSDIKDLAALKSVLGNGEAFKTWIATHST